MIKVWYESVPQGILYVLVVTSIIKLSVVRLLNDKSAGSMPKNDWILRSGVCESECSDVLVKDSFCVGVVTYQRLIIIY